MLNARQNRVTMVEEPQMIAQVLYFISPSFPRLMATQQAQTEMLMTEVMAEAPSAERPSAMNSKVAYMAQISTFGDDDALTTSSEQSCQGWRSNLPQQCS